jgi:integrase
MPIQKSTTARRLSKTTVEALVAPVSGQAVIWDAELTGFGVRVSDRGTKTYFIQGRLPDGRQVKVKIGRHGVITAEHARARAKAMLGAMAAGTDPAADRRAARKAETERRAAPTMGDLCARYLKEHAERRKRSRSCRGDRTLIERHILPAIGRRKAAEITFGDVEELHRRITEGAPIAANRTVSLLSKAFTLSIRWGYRTDNPCRGVERNHEERRERYLTPAELVRLRDALNRHYGDRSAAAIVFLMLTGARLGEVMTARWRDFSPTGIWVKPSAHTKQKRLHRVPLSTAARALLEDLAAEGDAAPDAIVFPITTNRIRVTWEVVRTEAALPGLRLHDLRHAYASLLVSSGLGLPVIGALLGHTTPVTTSRYAHLLDDPLRQATELVGNAWTGRV